MSSETSPQEPQEAVETSPTAPRGAPSRPRAPRRPRRRLSATRRTSRTGRDEDDIRSDALGRAQPRQPRSRRCCCVTDEPLDVPTLAALVRRPATEVAEQLAELAAEYADAGPRVRPARGGRRVAVLHPGRLRGGRRALRAGRPAGQAHPGGARDARGGRLPPAGEPRPDLRGPRGERRRRHPHAHEPRPGRRGGARRLQQARSSTGRRSCSWSAWASVPWRSCLPSQSICPTLSCSTTSSSKRQVEIETSWSRMTSDEGIRLQKVLAAAGMGSRRACEEMIDEGRVEVDGRIVLEQGLRVDPRSSVIKVDGMRIPTAPGHVVLALNKPRGVHSTMTDDRGRPCVGDYLRGRKERLFHVGRLDADTEGLLLLTNDGELAQRLAHPSARGHQDLPGPGQGHHPARPGQAAARRGRARRRPGPRRPVPRGHLGARAVAGRGGAARGSQARRAPHAGRGRAPGRGLGPGQGRPDRARRPALRARCARSPMTEVGELYAAVGL